MTLEQIKAKAISAIELGLDFETVIMIAAEQIRMLKERERSRYEKRRKDSLQQSNNGC